MNGRINGIVIVLLASLGTLAAFGEVVRIVREPRLVPSVSSKTEKAWTVCSMCSSKVSYERTYKRDAYNNTWIETTKEVPTLCRKCTAKEKDLEKLRKQERVLDRKLEQKALKERIEAKKELLRN